MTIILQGLVLGISVAAMPGPFQTYLISQSLRSGWRASLILAFAPLLSDIFIISLVLTVLSRLPQSSLEALRLIGGIYILTLAWGVWRSYKAAGGTSSGQRKLPTSFFSAALVNLLNPNPYIFWSTVGGPLLLTGWRSLPWLAVGFLASFYLAVTLINSLTVVAFGLAGEKAGRWSRYLPLLAAAGLAVFGLVLLSSGLQNIFSLLTGGS